jgi:hypothetical protein
MSSCPIGLKRVNCSVELSVCLCLLCLVYGRSDGTQHMCDIFVVLIYVVLFNLVYPYQLIVIKWSCY